MKRNLAVALIGIFLGVPGCTSLHEADRVGEGPLTLSPIVADGFERFQREYSTGYFAVSADGTAGGYSGCPAVYDRCWGAATVGKAIAQCEKRSGGTPCYTFAIDHRIVWRGYDGARAKERSRPATRRLAFPTRTSATRA